MTIKELAEYANRQADNAQVRLLKFRRKQEGDQDVKDIVLYDDTYWQQVLDRIRFELIQMAEEK